jgi:hypothetical protein
MYVQMSSMGVKGARRQRGSSNKHNPRPKKNDWGKMRTAEVVATASWKVSEGAALTKGELGREGAAGHEE